jgi:hypothetical protein
MTRVALLLCGLVVATTTLPVRAQAEGEAAGSLMGADEKLPEDVPEEVPGEPPAVPPAEPSADAAPEPAAEPVPTQLRRFVLVAGANDGGPGRAALRYAMTDASAVAKVMGDLGGVLEDDLVLLESPDTATLLATLTGFAPRMHAADARVEFLLYYSGHSDETGLLLGHERLAYRELKDAVDALPADVRIVVLDSCASGALTRLKGGTHKAPFLIDTSSDVKGHAFLTSSSADESAQESDRIGGSFFTHYLVSGMRGAADITGDGRVTLNEAYQYAFHETLRRTEGTAAGAQHASYDIQLVGAGDLVMTDLRAAEATLVLAEDIRGRVWLRDGDGALVAELRKSEPRPLHLSVPPGELQLHVEDRQEAWGGRVEVVAGEVSTVKRSELAPAALEATTSRGGLDGHAGGVTGVGQGGYTLKDVSDMRYNGNAMFAGGMTTAAIGGCCILTGTPALFISILANMGPNCTATAGACTVLGVLFAAFGGPVAWLGRDKLDEASEIEEVLLESSPQAATLPAGPVYAF